MQKEKLPPIPTPVSQRWREFKIQIVPLLVFLTVVACIVQLWRSHVQPVGVIGAVETNWVNVTCLQDGVLSELFVERFQTVTAGQEIAVITKTDPELIAASIASVQADMKVQGDRLRVDQRRTEQNYQELTQELETHLLQQVIEKESLALHSNEFVRATQLYTNKPAQISEADLDKARTTFKTLQASIQQRERLIASYQDMVKRLAPKQLQSGQTDSIDSALEAKANELRLMLEPSRLKAPVSGMISMVHHVAGERVLRGMPIVSISDPVTRRIVGYVRQPVLEVPTTNDRVRIVTRTQPRQIADGQIISVGAQMEPISPALLAPDNKRVEVGLPILVAIPPTIKLLPGEHVNLFIEFVRP